MATTFATVGLVGGMLIGIFLINYASRQGLTMVLDKPAAIPESLAKGYTADAEKQPSLGRETTVSSSIETVTVHLGIMLGVSALAYWVLSVFRRYDIPGLSSIPAWFYALLLMYAVNFLIKALKLDWMIDKKVKSRITGCMSDIAITAAIGSMSVKTVMNYAGPIALLSVIGFVLTYLVSFPAYRWFFGRKDYPFERAVMSWGVNTGVMINGLMLLKICDPDYESPALADFSVGFALMSVLSIFTSAVFFPVLEKGTPASLLLTASAITLGYLALAVAGRVLLKREAPEHFE